MSEHPPPGDPVRPAPTDPSGYADPGRPDFCARCGGPMRVEPRGGRERPICPACGWVYYARNALGAAVAIEGPEGILLVRRAHEPYRREWMLPAGFVEYGEFAEDSAVREAEEETGYQVELTGLWGFYYGTDDPRNVSHLAVYGARVVGGEAQAGDDAEALEFFPRGALPSRIAFQGHRRALADWEGDPTRGVAPTLGDPRPGPASRGPRAEARTILEPVPRPPTPEPRHPGPTPTPHPGSPAPDT